VTAFQESKKATVPVYTPPPEDKTALYVAAGVGGLALLGIVIYVATRNSGE
jgi:hypothetical protein